MLDARLYNLRTTSLKRDFFFLLFQPSFELELVTKIGLGISLLCLALSIFTFKFCRSIQGTRTTIHLHLCICLFMADLFFLAGISQVKPEVCQRKTVCSFSRLQ